MNRWELITLCSLSVWASGCGGGSSAPPDNPSPPPPTVSAPPETVAPQVNSPAGGGNSPAPTRPVAAKPAQAVSEGPPEQMFDLTEDRANFTLDTRPPASQLFYVIAAIAEGSVLSVERLVEGTPSSARKLPTGFTAVPGAGFTETGWPRRIRGDVDGKEMVCVPNGLFTEGTNNGTADASPAHPMSQDTYYIDTTEVTVGEFAKFKAAVLGKEGAPAATVPLNGDPRRPVVKLSWKDAHNYAKWAKKDLPTEAEWEKAGRGPDAWVFPWGNDRVIWQRSRLPGQIDPVGSYPLDRSRYGALDMSGNAREWCSDWYHSEAYAEAKGKDGLPPHNWTGPRKASNGERVVKGSNERWELWSRGSHSMTKPAEDIGFRCVVRCGAEETPEQRP